MRLLRFLPALASLATFGVFVVDRTSEAGTLFGSPKGLFVVGVIIAGYVALGIGLKRFVATAWVPPVVLALVVLALAAWTILPYYRQQEVNRTLVAGPVTDATPAAASTTTMSVTTTPTTVTAGAVRTSTGALKGIDHRARGTASIIRAADGSAVVRFERFSIEGAPDPQLYVVKGSDARKPQGQSLGRMPGNAGDLLDVALPAASEAGPGWTVLIWCGRFAVPIANATQQAP